MIQKPEAPSIQSRNASKDQIAWYDRKSLFNQRVYKRIKVVEILAAGDDSVSRSVASPSPACGDWSSTSFTRNNYRGVVLAC